MYLSVLPFASTSPYPLSLFPLLIPSPYPLSLSLSLSPLLIPSPYPLTLSPLLIPSPYPLSYSPLLNHKSILHTQHIHTHTHTCECIHTHMQTHTQIHTGINNTLTVLTNINTTSDTLEQLGSNLQDTTNAIASNVSSLTEQCVNASMVMPTLASVCSQFPPSDTFATGADFSQVCLSSISIKHFFLSMHLDSFVVSVM